MGLWKEFAFATAMLSILALETVQSLPKNCTLIDNGICYITQERVWNTYEEADRNCSENGGRLARIQLDELERKLANALNASDPYYYHREQYYNSYWIHTNNVSKDYYYNQECLIWNPARRMVSLRRCDYGSKFICEYGGYSCSVKNLTITNGFFRGCHSEENLPFQSTVTIECDEDYILDGPQNVTCTTDGVWSTAPRCVRGCTTPDPVKDAYLLAPKKSYFVNESATFICHPGTYSSVNSLATHITITCNEHSEWTPAPVSCEMNTKWRIERVDVKLGQPFKLRCQANNLLTDSTQKHENWQWLKDSKPIENGYINATISDNGDLRFNNFTVHDIGTYICFYKGNETVIGKTVYYVREAYEQCDKGDNKTRYVTMDEGTSAYLTCDFAHVDSEITWLLNEDKIYSRYLKEILPDGTLFFPKVDGSIAGVYTCIVRNRYTNCDYVQTTAVTVSPKANSTCGIVGSMQPWTVSLWWNDELDPFCYGTLVDQKAVLTTAQCLMGYKRKRNPKAFVQIGGDDGNSSGRIAIESVIIHESFEHRRHINDIGLIKLKEKVTFTNSLMPICLNSKEMISKNTCTTGSSSRVEGVVSGWGSLESGYSKESADLKQANITILSSNGNSSNENECSYTESIICGERIANDTFFAADYGSPLAITWKGRVYLLGIYSLAGTSAYGKTREYFTKVPAFMYWLKFHLEN